MIQPLRSTHRLAFPVLAVILPAIVAAGLASRRPESPTVVRQNSRMPRRSTHASVSISRNNTGLKIEAVGAFDYPDVLAYLSDTATLTERSHLLGEFVRSKANTYSVPADAAHGYIVLYSPATQSVIDTVPLGGSR